MASGLKSEIEQKFEGSEVELVAGSGGMFEVSVDGQLIFSKKKLDRFPTKGEVSKIVYSLQSN